MQSLHVKASNNKYSVVHLRDLYKFLCLFLNNFVWDYTGEKDQTKEYQ
jgi:hypothetical protein